MRSCLRQQKIRQRYQKSSPKKTTARFGLAPKRAVVLLQRRATASYVRRFRRRRGGGGGAAGPRAPPPPAAATARRSLRHFRRATDLHRHELGAGREPDVLRVIDHVGDRRSPTAEVERQRQQFVARIRLVGVQRIARNLEQEVAGRGHRAAAGRSHPVPSSPT